VITIGINGTKEAEFEQTQIDAFSRFLQNIEKLLLDVELSIYEYYQEVYLDYRERREDSADKVAPIISSVEEAGNLVQLNEIIFPWSFKTGIRQVGLLLNCTWEPEHGLAVKFEDEKIVEVGYRDGGTDNISRATERNPLPPFGGHRPSVVRTHDLAPAT
jgi:hypothetical protein